MIYLSSFLVLLASFCIYWNLIHAPLPFTPLSTEPLLRPDYVTQKRNQSEKDLWISQEGGRRHLHLLSEHSELFLENQEGKVEAIEQMEDLVCTEGAHRLTATEGTYSYRSRTMNLKNVKGLLTTPKREITLSAATANLDPAHCRAEGAVAITTSEALTAEGTLLDYFPDQNLLTLSSPEYCIFTLKQETFALADQCNYTLDSHFAVLESAFPRRVLFWQKESSHSLSAPQIKIGLRPQELEAFGDTHCTFDEAEQNILKSFFFKVLMKTLLEVRSLKKFFQGNPVVNDLSFEVQEGEAVGLLGPNGAGKTTAFYMTIGLIRPDEGEVFFKGTEITHLPMHLRAKMGLGYLAQEPSIFRHLTVEENILAILEICPLTRTERQERLEQLLGELGLGPLRKKKAVALSGGERRRLEITRSLVTNPSLLLLDEPFANIDPLAIADLKNLIRHLLQKGISVLITDHNAREIFSIVSRSYLIQGGRVLKSGTVNELVNDPEARLAYFGNEFKL